MGLHPEDFADVFAGLDPPPLAIGANCGVGASDILVTLLEMAGANGDPHLISKGNCGVPLFHGADIVYSGTPDLMAEYARLAVDGGAAIVGGCCGTSPEHLRSMRVALDTHTAAHATDDTPDHRAHRPARERDPGVGRRPRGPQSAQPRARDPCEPA